MLAQVWSASGRLKALLNVAQGNALGKQSPMNKPCRGGLIFHVYVFLKGLGRPTGLSVPLFHNIICWAFSPNV